MIVSLFTSEYFILKGEVKEFEAKSVCILGRQPMLGMAELERLYGSEHLQPLSGAAMLDLPVEAIEFKRLGGTIKLAKVLNILPTTSWPKLTDYLMESIPQHLQHLPEGTFTLGLSTYNLQVPVGKIKRDMLALKKIIRQNGRSVRIVPNKNPALNSAQVLHNKLTSRGAWELILIGDSKRTILAQTFFVQDIEAYAARDQVRPARDARVGMLPPKLAQIMLNLASPPKGASVLDPFCGTGVVLQEALLMGYGVIGSDIDKRMVEFTDINLQWLSQKYDIPKDRYQVMLADATSDEWLSEIDAVVSEIHLGRPLKSLPPTDQLNLIIDDINRTLQKFLLNLAQQLKSNAVLCLAVPAWRRAGSKLIELPLIDQLTEMGYTYLDLEHVRGEGLVYFREDQTVARRLLVLRKA